MHIWWCDANNGSDTTGDGSKNNPYLTIDKALVCFTDGDQIRLMPGTYTPTDSVVISGKNGSIFSDVPKASYIQPLKTTLHQACIAAIDADRFTVAGVVVLQAADSFGNLIGIYAENIENFVCMTAEVTNFNVPSGNAVGIFASGGGRVIDCKVYSFNGAGEITRGIWVKGVEEIDCICDEVSGVNRCIGIDIEGLNYA